MADTVTVSLENLGEAIAQQLELYNEEVNEGINKAARKAVKKLVEETYRTAPIGKRGEFVTSIASKKLSEKNGEHVYAWYVRAPNAGLTHLIVHGHATRKIRSGKDQTSGNSFLSDALAPVLEDFERDVQEVIKNGK